MLIVNIVAGLFFLVGLVLIAGCWNGSIINSFKEREPGFGFFALGLLLVLLALLAARFAP